MARTLKLVGKSKARRSVLVYGMRLIDADEFRAVEDGQIKLVNGSDARVTMHVIEGTRGQIQRQLLQSIDAFFELFDES
jgi:hypothetical protein